MDTQVFALQFAAMVQPEYVNEKRFSYNHPTKIGGHFLAYRVMNVELNHQGG